MNISDDLVYEWVRFFKGQVYDWGRFRNTDRYHNYPQVTPRPHPPAHPPPPPPPTRVDSSYEVSWFYGLFLAT